MISDLEAGAAAEYAEREKERRRLARGGLAKAREYLGAAKAETARIDGLLDRACASLLLGEGPLTAVEDVEQAHAEAAARVRRLESAIRGLECR